MVVGLTERPIAEEDRTDLVFNALADRPVLAAQTLLDEFEVVWRARIDRFTDVLNPPNEGVGP